MRNFGTFMDFGALMINREEFFGNKLEEKARVASFGKAQERANPDFKRMETFNQNNKLTVKEIKLLKQTLWRQIFPSLTATLFLFLIIFVFASLKNNFGLVFISLTLLSIVIGAIVFYFITKNYRLELKTGEVKQEKEIVEDKIYKLDYEPGSASFPISLLSILFIKKISKLEMKEMHIYYIIVKGERIDLDKSDFEKVEKGQPIIIRRTPISDLFLGIETI